MISILNSLNDNESQGLSGDNEEKDKIEDKMDEETIPDTTQLDWTCLET
jgi:hypothetical protein